MPLMKLFTSLLLSLFLISACGSADNSGELTNYSDLPELDISLISEAGEGNGYFPGRIQHLFISSSGNLLVGDMGSNTIEQFSPEGEHRATIAVQGGGPGEISGFFTIHDVAGDTLMLENQGGRRDLFYPNSDGIYTYTRNMAGESGSFDGSTITGVRTDSEFYATRRRVIRNPMEMMSNSNDYHDTYIHIIGRDNHVVADSIQHLRAPELHMQSVNGGFRISEIPYRNRDRFVPLSGGGYLVATPFESMIHRFDENHELLSTIDLRIDARPVTAADLDHHLQDISSDLRREIEPRVYNIKPPFLNVWASEERIWLQTDRTADGSEIVAADYEGQLIGRFLLSGFDEVKQVTGNRIYTIHRDPDVGDSVRIYEVTI